jgi:integrase
MKDQSIEQMLKTLRSQVHVEVEAEFFDNLGKALGIDLDRDNINDNIEYLKSLMPKSPKRFIHATKSNKKLENIIDGMKPRPDKMYMKAVGDGLNVRVYPSGRKMFTFRYMFNGRRPSPVDLGPYVPSRERTPDNLGIGLTVEEAIEKVIDLRRKLLDKKDPTRFVHRKGISVKKLFDQYLLEYFKSKDAVRTLSTADTKEFRVVSDKYYRRICVRFEKFILPDLGGRPVVTIDSFETQAILDAVEASNGCATADEVRKALSGLIRWATEHKKHKNFVLLEGIKQIKGDAKRIYILKVSDIKVFYDYLTDDNCPIPEVQRRILLAMLCIGSRNQETAEAMWEEFDRENRLWIVPARRMKGNEPGNGKTRANGYEGGIKRPHAIFLTDLLLELLGTPLGKAVFIRHYIKKETSNDLPSSAECPQNGINQAKECESFEFPFPELTAYCLRHTFSSHMDSLGFSPLSYGRCQSHSDYSTRASEQEAIKLGHGMAAKKHYAHGSVFKSMRKKAEVWIAWEAELCKQLGRPIPEYPDELLDYYEELGKPGNDEEFFAARPELLEAIIRRY